MEESGAEKKFPAEMASSKYNGKLKINGIEGKTPFLIGVAGGTASGKSTVCKRIMEKLGQADVDHAERQVVTISQDSFYRELTQSEKEKAAKGLFNFDHPDAFDDQLILKTMKDILRGNKCEIPVYDYIINSRMQNQYTTIYPADVVLFEGILVFYFPEVRDLFHMKLFVDTDSDTRLARRVPRDIRERGRDLDQVLHQYMNFVKPAFEDFCMPTKKFADVIIPRGADNTVAIDLIVDHICNLLRSGSSSFPFSPSDQLYNGSLRRLSSESGSLSLAIDLIVQHIRDFLNNRNNTNCPMPLPPSPAPSPVHGIRRYNTFDGVHFSRPH